MADRRVSVRVDANVTPYQRGMAGATSSTEAFRRSLRSTDKSIDQLSGRLALATRAVAAFGPAFVPMGANAVPALAGLSTQLGFAAAGAGTAILAFNGVGDALDALNQYQLEPTEENFAKLQEELRGLGPAAREFVVFLDEIIPQLQTIRESAQEGLLPGVQQGLDAALDRLSSLRRIVSEIADASGDLLAGAGVELASSEWDDFFRFLEAEARPALTTLGRTVGNVAKGIAELWMAMDPFSDDFTAGLLDASEAFESWAEHLSETEGFQEFLTYVRDTGPQVLETVGSLANMLLQVAEAAAPLGGPVLQAVEALADAIAIIADSPIGPPLVAAASATSALRLATTGWSKVSQSAWATNVRGAEGYVSAMGAAKRATGLIAAGIASLAVAAQENATGFDATNTAMGIFAGAMVGGPVGAAIGGGIGLMGDLASSTDALSQALDRANDAIGSGNLPLLRQRLDELQAAQRNLAESDTVGQWFSEVSGQADDVEDALRGVRNEIELLDRSKGGIASLLGGPLGDALGYTAEAFEVAAYSADEFADSLEGVNRVLDRRGSFRDYRESIRQFAETLKDAPANIKKYGPAWDQLQGDLDGIAREALEVAGNLKGMNRIEFLAKARKQFLAAAEDMKIPKREAEALADQLGLLGKKKPKPEVNLKDKASPKAREVEKTLKALDTFTSIPEALLKDRATGHIRNVQGHLNKLDNFEARSIASVTDRASGTLRAVRGQLSAIDGYTAHATITTTRIEKVQRMLRAQGGPVYGPGSATSDSIPAMLSNGEYVIRAAAVDRYGPAFFDAANAMRLASGGMVGMANGGSVDRAEILRLREEIRDLMKELAAEGKEAISGLERRRVAADLRDARRELREERSRPRRELREGLTGAIGGFDLAGLVGRGDPRNPTLAETRREFAEFRRSIKDAGGEWTKALERQRDKVMRNALAMDRQQRAIERETAVRDRLTESVAEQQQKLGALVQQMQQFGAEVAGNFLGSPFGQSLSVTVPGRVDPGLSRRLMEAEARLTGIRSSANPAAMSAEASRLIPQIAAMRAEVERQAEPIERTISGWELMREQLQQNTADALAFTGALKELRGGGLAPGLFAELARSGDLNTALGLVSGGDAAIEEANRLWRERAEATAELEALATDTVFGERLYLQQAALDRQIALAEASNIRLERLNSGLERAADRIVAAQTRVISELRQEIAGLKTAVKDQPRQHRDNRRAGRGRS